MTNTNDGPIQGKRHVIFINDSRHEVQEASLTGGELKALGDVPPGNTLFIEVPGPEPDRKIDDAETIDLRSGMRFYDLPPIRRGGRVEEEVELLASRYREVRTEPASGGQWVSVAVDLPNGWEGEDSRIGTLVPSRFPSNKPSGFSFSTPLIRPNGGRVTGNRQHEGRTWKEVCWQVQRWDPARETLWRYFKAMERWFVEGWR